MMEIKKPTTLFTKLFKKFFLFIVVALCSFFGCIYFFGYNVTPLLPSTPTIAEVPPFGKFIQNMMSLKNIHAEDFNFEIKDDAQGFDIKLSGDVTYDETGLDVDVSLTYNGEQTFIRANYMQSSPDLYVGINDVDYLFSTNSISNGKEINLEGLINLISNNINVDFSGVITDLTTVFGIDLENFDISQIAKDPIELEDGYRFNIKLGNGILQAEIETDDKYNITSAKTPAITIGDFAILINAPKILMNNIEISVPEPEINDFVDLRGINDYIGFAENLFEQNYVSGNVAITLSNGKNYDVDLKLDNSNGVKAKLSTEVEEILIDAVYDNNIIYLSLKGSTENPENGLNLKLDLNDIEKWNTTINNILTKHYGITTTDLVNQMIDKIKAKSQEINTEEEIFKLLAGILSNSKHINEILPYTALTEENSLTMLWNRTKDDGSLEEDKIVLESFDIEETTLLKKAYIDLLGIVIDANFEVSQEQFDFNFDYTNFYDVTTLLDFENLVDEILTNKKFGGEISVKFGNDGVLNVDYVVNFDEKIIAELNTSICSENQEKNIKLFLNETNFYLVIDELIIEGDYQEIETYLDKLQNLGVPLTNDKKLEVKEIIEKVRNVLTNLQLKAEEGAIAVVEYVASLKQKYVINISLQNNQAQIELSNNDIIVNCTLSKSDKKVEMPFANDELLKVLSKAEILKTYINSKQFLFNFSFNYNKINLSGSAILDLENKIFYIQGKLGVNNIIIHIENKAIYLDLNGNKIKLDISKYVSLDEKKNALLDKIIEIINANIDSDESDLSGLSNFLINMFGQDLSKLSISQLIKMGYVSVDGNTDDLTIDLDYNSNIPYWAQIKVGFVENNLTQVSFSIKDNRQDVETYKMLTGNINILNEEEKEELSQYKCLTEEEKQDYYNLTSNQTGILNIKIIEKIEDKTVENSIPFNIAVELSDSIKIKVWGSAFGENFELVIIDNIAKIKIGGDNGIIYSVDLKNAKSLYNQIVKTFEIEKSKLNILEILNSLDFGKLLNVNGLSYNFGKIDDVTVMNLSYDISNNVKLEVKLNDEQVLNNEIILPSGKEQDISDLMLKIKDIYNLINLGDLNFKFDLTYNINEFPVDGTFKFLKGKLDSKDEFELIINNIVGEKLVARLKYDYESKKYVLYFKIANIKIKYVIDGKTSDNVTEETINTIESTLQQTVGVNIDLGVFQYIIDMIQNYTISDYLTNIKLDIFDNLLNVNNEDITESIGINVNRNDQDMDMFAGAVNFKNNTLYSLDVNVYNMIKANLKVVNGIAFEELNKKEYNDSIVYGLLSSLSVLTDEIELEDGMYAISTDVAIRYVFTTFYGTLTAILIQDPTYDSPLIQDPEYVGPLKHLKPVIQLYTTSLGLDTYIYVVGEVINGKSTLMLYVDLQGLQLKMQYSEENINKILNFVEKYFNKHIDLPNLPFLDNEPETQQLKIQETVETFKVVIPTITNIFVEWCKSLTDERNGLKVTVDGSLVYMEDGSFDNIVAKVLIDTANGKIEPEYVMIGTDIEDTNTSAFDETTEYPKDAEENEIEWHLKKNQGQSNDLLEEQETLNKNFAVYLTNFHLGYFDELQSKFKCTLPKNDEPIDYGCEYKYITDVQSNNKDNHFTALKDFIDIDVILKYIETTYEYFKPLEYHIVIDGSKEQFVKIKDEVKNNVQYKTIIKDIDAEILVEFESLEGVENPSKIPLFDNNFLNIQAHLDFVLENIVKEPNTQEKVNSVRHIIDLDYDSRGKGLYVSYTHGKNINIITDSEGNIEDKSTKFSVFIANENLSDILAMIVDLLQIDLSNDVKTQLNILNRNQTDFTFLRELIFPDTNDESLKEDYTYVSGLLNDITNALHLLRHIQFEDKIEQETHLLSLLAELDLTNLNMKKDDSLTPVRFNVIEKSNGVYEFDRVIINDAEFAVLDIDFNIYDKNDESKYFNYHARNSGEHKDLSTLPKFVDMLVNTLNTKGLNLHMSYEPENNNEEEALKLLGGLYKLRIGIDLEIKIDANNKLQVYAEVRTQTREIVTFDNVAGWYGHSYTNVRPTGKVESNMGKKVSTLNFSYDKAIDNYKLVITQYNTYNAAGNNNDDKLKIGGEENSDWVYTLSEIGQKTHFYNNNNELFTFEDSEGKLQDSSTNIFKIIAQTIGMTNSVTNDIIKLVATMTPDPTIEELFLGYQVTDIRDDAGTFLGNDYMLKLNGANLTGVKEFKDFELHILSHTSNYKKNKRYLNFIDQIKTSLNIAGVVTINLNLHSKDGNYYNGINDMKYMPTHRFTTNTTYRDEYCKNKITFVENNGPDVDDIYAYEDDEITLPNYETYVIDDIDGSKTKTTRVFDGWWTTEDFQENTRFNSNIMPNSNITLYAKWKESYEYYRTVKFETNDYELHVDDIVKLEGESFIVPYYTTIIHDDKQTQKEVKEFKGWWTSPNFEEGTKYDELYIIPTHDLTLYAKWDTKVYNYYTLEFVSNNEEEQYENKFVLEGETFSIPIPSKLEMQIGNEKKYYKEETVENTTRYYTFDGWWTTSTFEEGTRLTSDVMPQNNLTLYAKWDFLKEETTYLVTMYDNNVEIDRFRVIENDKVDFTGKNKVVDGDFGTKFYLDSNYQNEITNYYIMPNHDIEVHIRNRYKVVFKSKYYNTADVEYYLYQGEKISMPTQQSYKDDKYGKELIEYNFHGYEETITVIPNENKIINAIWDVVTTPYVRIEFHLDWYLPKIYTAGTTTPWVIEKYVNNEEAKAIYFNPKDTEKNVTYVLQNVKNFDLTQIKTTIRAQYKLDMGNKWYTWNVVKWSKKPVGNQDSGVEEIAKITDLSSTETIHLYAVWG